jgi:hypothetical protein
MRPNPRHFPFLIAMMGFSILSGSIQTMHRWQNAEVRGGHFLQQS